MSKYLIENQMDCDKYCKYKVTNHKIHKYLPLCSRWIKLLKFPILLGEFCEFFDVGLEFDIIGKMISLIYLLSMFAFNPHCKPALRSEFV
jgi:hypothetical protein